MFEDDKGLINNNEIENDTLELEWEVAVPVDRSRVSHMYCFKNCSVNSN